MPNFQKKLCCLRLLAAETYTTSWKKIIHSIGTCTLWIVEVFSLVRFEFLTTLFPQQRWKPEIHSMHLCIWVEHSVRVKSFHNFSIIFSPFLLRTASSVIDTMMSRVNLFFYFNGIRFHRKNGNLSIFGFVVFFLLFSSLSINKKFWVLRNPHTRNFEREKGAKAAVAKRDSQIK